jgi:DNA-binding XRE family transcriptional regulator
MTTKTGKSKPRKTVTVNGRRYVLVAESELRRLEQMAVGAEAQVAQAPPLLPADARGDRPAAAYTQASIARSILQKRTALGISQRDLAKLAGVRQETICRLESGKHAAVVRTVERIEHALEKAARTNQRR